MFHKIILFQTVEAAIKDSRPDVLCSESYPKFDSRVLFLRILKKFLFVYFAGVHSF